MFFNIDKTKIYFRFWKYIIVIDNQKLYHIYKNSFGNFFNTIIKNT